MAQYIIPSALGMGRDQFHKFADRTVPYTVGSVYAANDIPFMEEDVSDGIDLDWLNHLEECEEEYHDGCGPEEQGTTLVGDWKQDHQGNYVVNRKGRQGYAAVYLDGDIHLFWSTRRGQRGWCSPCAPGQCHASTPGKQRCYLLPKHMLEQD